MGPLICQVTKKACSRAITNTGVAVKSITCSMLCPQSQFVYLSMQKSIRSVHIFTDALQHIDDLAIVTKQDRLNHLSVLHVHQDRLDVVNFNKLKVDFASANEYRRTVFGHKQLLM